MDAHRKLLLLASVPFVVTPLTQQVVFVLDFLFPVLFLVFESNTKTGLFGSHSVPPSF